MPYRQLPKSDTEVTKAIDGALKRWNDLALNPAKRIITPAHFAALDPSDPASFLSRWRKENAEANTALNDQLNMTNALQATFGVAVQVINHFFIVFDLGVDRHVFPAADRVLFERPENATSIPVITNYADALLWGERIRVGEAARQDAGAGSYLPMSLPSANDVANLVNSFSAIHGQQDETQSDAADEARDVASLRPEGDTLIRSMWNTIEFHLSEDGLTPSALREEGRRWGITYVSRPGEPEDPAPEPTPPVV